MAEQGDVVAEGRVAPIVWAPPVFSLTLGNCGLDRAYQLRPALALARVSRHGVRDLRYTIECAIEKTFALKVFQLLVERSPRIRLPIRGT